MSAQTADRALRTLRLPAFTLEESTLGPDGTADSWVVRVDQVETMCGPTDGVMAGMVFADQTIDAATRTQLSLPDPFRVVRTAAASEVDQITGYFPSQLEAIHFVLGGAL